MSDTPELKPCPFCGGEAEITNGPDILGVIFDDMVRVVCECGRSDAHIYKTNEAAVTAWNTRADLAELKGQDDE